MKPISFLIMFFWVGLGLTSQSFSMEQASTDDKSKCQIPSGQAISGDYKLPSWIPTDYVTFGPSASVQGVRYDLALKKAALTTGVGAGFSARFYNNVKIKTVNGVDTFEFNDIRTECRRTTFDVGRGTNEDRPKIVGPAFSITPIIYYSKGETTDTALQPAIQFGFLEELVNIGVGFNLTGPNKGHAFVLLSLGFGFRLDK